MKSGEVVDLVEMQSLTNIEANTPSSHAHLSTEYDSLKSGDMNQFRIGDGPRFLYSNNIHRHLGYTKIIYKKF